MKSTRIFAHRVDLPLVEGSYKWSGGKSVSVFDSTIIGIETECGLIGYGEVCPRRLLTLHTARLKSFVSRVPISTATSPSATPAALLSVRTDSCRRLKPPVSASNHDSRDLANGWWMSPDSPLRESQLEPDENDMRNPLFNERRTK